MLTRLTIRNFKVFGEEETTIPLDNGVVFVGPNNSGKSTALQALTLWREGLVKLSGKLFPKGILAGTPIALASEEELLGEVNLNDRLAEIAADAFSIPRNGGNKRPSPRKQQRSGVGMNRLELTSLPTPVLDMLWRGRKTRRGAQPIPIDITVAGENAGREWECGLEFDTVGGDSFYCRPLRLEEGKNPPRMGIPLLAYATKVAMLPPMSGLALEEPRFEDKRINALIGEGRTADVLRNLCYRVAAAGDGGWEKLTGQVRTLFGASLLPPVTDARGAFVMQYTERDDKTKLDLQFSGRGMQQVILLLAFLRLNPNSALLLDEPDAHLEILRQREIYRTLLDAAAETKSQIIVASHSEALLNEAAAPDGGAVVAFVGKPHPLVGNRKDEVLKALREIGWDQYYLAEQKHWVLYLEGETDLPILRAFAERLNHPAQDTALRTPFCKFVLNQPDNARRHFYALREAHPEFRGVLLVDSDVKGLEQNAPLVEMKWRRREAESYLCTRRTLLNFAASQAGRPGGPEECRAKMEAEIRATEEAMRRLEKPNPFSSNVKVSDEFLAPLLRNFAKAIGVFPELRKADFYKLVDFIPDDELAADTAAGAEMREKLDAIYAVAERARPGAGGAGGAD